MTWDFEIPVLYVPLQNHNKWSILQARGQDKWSVPKLFSRWCLSSEQHHHFKCKAHNGCLPAWQTRPWCYTLASVSHPARCCHLSRHRARSHLKKTTNKSISLFFPKLFPSLDLNKSHVYTRYVWAYIHNTYREVKIYIKKWEIQLLFHYLGQAMLMHGKYCQ